MYKKILIIRLSSMGDVVLTTFLTRILRQAFPTSLIDFITSNSFAEIYKFNKRINHLHIYDKSAKLNEILNLKKSIRKAIQEANYDLIIDLQNNRRSHFLRKYLGHKILQLNKYRLAKIAQVYLKKNLFKETLPIPIRYLHTLESLGIRDDGRGLELWLEEDYINNCYELDKSHNAELNRIAIAPGAYHFTKRYPAEKFVNLIQEIKKIYKSEIALIGGKDDKPICDFIQESVSFPLKNCSGSVSIIETTKELSTCDLLITNDTGVMHIASARQVPLIAIFGSSVQSFGFAPFRVPHRVVEKDVPCRPCSHIGKTKCPKTHFNCMNLIETSDIIENIEKLIEELKSN